MLETISFCGRKIESIASSLANLHKVIVGIMCGFPLAYSMYRKQSVVFRSCCSNAFQVPNQAVDTFYGLPPKVTFAFLNIFLRRCVGARE